MAGKAVYRCSAHGTLTPPIVPTPAWSTPERTCQECWALYGQYLWKVKSRRARGGGQSSKAKGRSGCETAHAALMAAAPPTLTAEDIFIKTTSQMGVDLHFSPLARVWFPFSLEVKNVEGLNIWAALRQADAQAAAGAPAIVFFKRANTELFAALRASDFLKLLPWPHPENRPLLPPSPPAPVAAPPPLQRRRRGTAAPKP